MAPKRELIKGPLRPPQPQPRNQSYTQKPASKDEISVRTGKEKEIPGKSILFACSNSQLTRPSAVEFSSQIPKPFLDPSIIQRRIQADKQWKAEQAKKSKQEGEPSHGK
jgi:hypothetical protein